MPSLAGHCIVTTRPASQTAGLARALEAAGAEVLNFPVIDIEADDPAPLRALSLSDFSLAFFVSPNAVEHALATLPRNVWPSSLQVATVGPASAQALRSHGFATVVSPAKDFDSEGVLALPEFAAVAVVGKHILILRGNGGREQITDTLRQRGAIVETISCYRRFCARLDPRPLTNRFQAGEISALVFTASEGLRNFLQIMGAVGPQMLHSLPCFAPHPRICGTLQEAGCPHPVLAPGGDAGIAEGIIRALCPPPNQSARQIKP
jgi:uroporphyrinogen-III synthase